MAKSRKPSLLQRLAYGWRKKAITTIGNIELIKRLQQLVDSKEGEYWRERYSPYQPPLVPDQALLFEKAKQFALEQLEAQDHAFSLTEVDAALNDISCQMDEEVHRVAGTASHIIMGHFFQHQMENRHFCSPDGREQAHAELLREYQKQGLGVVYLCNHSSHIDEFIVDEALDSLRLGMPLFAAGSNLMVLPNLNRVLKLGSYTVQRRASGRVYLACLFSYCRAISETGCQQGIFLEAWHGGARSRDGSLRYPRRLITLRGALALENRDLVIQPVAISYSIVPEDLYLAANGGAWGWVRGMGFWRSLGRLLLNPKWGLWRAGKGLYGRAYCTFTRPRLLSELKEMHAADVGGMSLDEFVALTAMKEVACAKKVMASQLVARGLIRARKDEHLSLSAALKQERDQLIEYHQATFGQAPDLEDFILNNDLEAVLNDGLKSLRKRKVLKLGKDRRGLPKVSSERALSFYATHGDRRLYSPTAKENVVVAGAGDLSYAWAYLIGNRTLEEKRYLNASFTLYDSRSEAATEMLRERSLTGLYQEFRLPKNVFITDDSTSAFKKANLVILAPPVDQLKEQIDACLRDVELPVRLVLITNGFDPVTHKLSFQVALEAVQGARVPVSLYALAGPVLESDLLKGMPGKVVLAGPTSGLREVGHLFRWPPLQVVVGEDPLGLHLATVLAEVYGVWIAYASLSKEAEGLSNPGSYATEASVEALAWAELFGAEKETFGSISPIWLASLSAVSLSKQALALASTMLKQQGKRKENLSLLFSNKLKPGAEEPEFSAKLTQSFISLKFHADRQGLSVPIFQQAYASLLGGGAGKS